MSPDSSHKTRVFRRLLPSCGSQDMNPNGFSNQMFRGSSLKCMSSKLGYPMWGLLFMEKLWVLRSLLVVDYCAKGGAYAKTLSQTLLPALLCFLLICLVCNHNSARLQVFFFFFLKRKLFHMQLYSQLSVRRGEFRIFLDCRLLKNLNRGLIPSDPDSKRLSLNIVWRTDLYEMMMEERGLDWEDCVEVVTRDQILNLFVKLNQHQLLVDF